MILIWKKNIRGKIIELDDSNLIIEVNKNTIKSTKRILNLCDKNNYKLIESKGSFYEK